jgi:hypothetical protein
VYGENGKKRPREKERNKDVEDERVKKKEKVHALCPWAITKTGGKITGRTQTFRNSAINIWKQRKGLRVYKCIRSRYDPLQNAC